MQRLNNHSGVMQILSALQSSSVFRSAASHHGARGRHVLLRRLKHTWNGVREQEDTDYSRLAQQYSRDNNYDALRAIHNGAPPPIVPFLGMCASLFLFLFLFLFLIFFFLFMVQCVRPVSHLWGRYLSDITFIDEGNPDTVQVPHRPSLALWPTRALTLCRVWSTGGSGKC